MTDFNLRCESENALIYVKLWTGTVHYCAWLCITVVTSYSLLQGIIVPKAQCRISRIVPEVLLELTFRYLQFENWSESIWCNFFFHIDGKDIYCIYPQYMDISCSIFNLARSTSTQTQSLTTHMQSLYLLLTISLKNVFILTVLIK